MEPWIACSTVIVAMVLIVLLSMSTMSGSAVRSKNVHRNLLALVRQSARYAALADQDSNAVISMLHSTYALAFVTAARKLATDSALRRLSRVDVAELQNAAEAKQQRALSHINAQAPGLAVQSDQLRFAGWLL